MVRSSSLMALWLGLLATACAAQPSTDPQDGSLHCGATGRSCWGGQCLDGVCQPVKVGEGRGAMVADDRFVAWLADGFVHGRKLHSYLNTGPRAGDGKLALASDAMHLVLSDGLVFWAAQDGIYACSPNGCADGLAPVVKSNPGFTLHEDPFAVVGGQLIWMSRVSDVAYDLRRCAVAACEATATTVARMAQRHASLRPAVLLSDGTWVVLTEGAELRACRLDDCAGTLTTLSKDLFYYHATVGPKTYPRSVVALHSGRLFWHDRLELLTCQLGACTPTRFLPPGTLAKQDFIQADADSLYGLTEDYSAVTRFPLSGGEPTTVWRSGNISLFAVVSDFVLLSHGDVKRVAR